MMHEVANQLFESQNSLSLPVLEVGNELRQLGLHVEGGGEPARLRDQLSLLVALLFRSLI